MKKFRSILALALFFVMPLSCLQENGIRTEDPDGEGIVLDIRCLDPQTRAGMNGERDGESDWNENLLSTLDVFFYPEGKTGQDAVLHKRFTPGEADGDASVTTYTTDEFVSGTLAPGTNTSFWVYVVANYPGTLVADENNLSGTSVPSLKALPLSCDFSAPADHKQSDFVMDGLSQITGIQKDKRLVAKGLVKLRRLASKISVQLNIKDTVQVTRVKVVEDEEVVYKEVWEPMLNGIQMYIENGVSNTTLSGKPSESPVYFSYKNNRMSFTKSTDSKYADFPWLTDPTYVYPQRWTYASKTSPTIEPSIKLILPWRRRNDSAHNVTATQKQFYYKVIIPDDTRADVADTTYLRNFVQNNWYRFKLNVGILGSETDEASIQVNGHYYVLEWQDKEVVIKHAVIGQARFLSVEPKEYELNNVPDVDMLFTSSHPAALTKVKGGTELDITATKAYYGTQDAGTSYGGGTVRVAAAGDADYAEGQKYIEYSADQRKALNGGEDWLKVDGTYVKYYHEINNDYNAGESFDCAPYIVRYNLYHADHVEENIYKQSVKITQYPALYITSELSNGYVSVNDQRTTSGITDSSSNNIGSVVDASSVNGVGDNNNQNQYTVHVTVLPADSNYMIGDPRTDGSAAVVTTLTGLNSTANYRATAEDTQAIIAPVMKIASSYGKTNALWYRNARTRCAAYQENGYPAGRWRLPTDAEIEFLVTLSEKGVIPTLFSPGGQVNAGTAYHSYYWAGGYEAYYGSGFSNMESRSGDESTWNNQSYEYYEYFGSTRYRYHSVYTRCVYDVWYWGEDKDSSHLTSWGGFQTTK